MNIGGLQKLTLIDYPGKIACTVFLSGCNYRCPFCHNPELVLPETMSEHHPLPQADVLKFLKQRKEYLDGVCITGGEPTIHAKLAEFCEKVKNIGYEVKLDTNGSNPDMLKKLINKGVIDYVAMDIKGPREKYPKLIGYDCSSGYLLGKIDQSIDALKKSGIDFEFRTTIAPSLLTKRDMVRIARWLTPAKRYIIQNFRPGKTVHPDFANAKPYSDDFIYSLRELVAPYFEEIIIR